MLTASITNQKLMRTMDSLMRFKISTAIRDLEQCQKCLRFHKSALEVVTIPLVTKTQRSASRNTAKIISLENGVTQTRSRERVNSLKPQNKNRPANISPVRVQNLMTENQCATMSRLPAAIMNALSLEIRFSGLCTQACPSYPWN